MNPSLALIPCALDTGKLYSVLPDTGLGDLTVSRNGTGTYLGSDGLLKTALANEPRLEFNPDGTFKGVLVEPAATNLLIRSEEFNNAIWTNAIGGTGVNPIRIVNSSTSPSGVINADTIVLNRGAGNTISDQSTINQAVTATTTGIYTFSVYVKASTISDVGKDIFLRCGSNGVLTPFTLTSNWVRIQQTTNISSVSFFSSFQIGNRGTITVSNSVSVDVWGAQLELGSVATSYIPTVASTVTRPADVIRVQEPSGITQIKTINNNIETTTTPTGGLFTLPNGNIKRVLML